MAVCLNSATAAMELTLHLLGIGPGDEVITSAYTYTASASVIHHVGAKIILVDIQPNTWEMDYSQLSNKISNKTKAIIPVDIGGMMCDYDKLFEIVNSKSKLFCPNDNIFQKTLKRIFILADAAHSFGATYKGINNGMSKHTQDDIVKVLHMFFFDKKSNSEIGKQMNMNKNTVARIVSGETYRTIYNVFINKNPILPIRPTQSELQSLARKGVPQKKLTCPHCNKAGGNANMVRYHFDNCKNK
jgi:hypothetical protein